MTNTDESKILIVDDDGAIRNLIARQLTQEGYVTLTASSGIEAIQFMKSSHISLVILDVMMNGMDGVETCRRIRQFSHVPILMLSAKDTDVNRTIGLTVGADDYLNKPYSSIELLARVRAQLRRAAFFEDTQLPLEADVLLIKGLEIRKSERRVLLYGQEVSLTRKEFDILILLAQNPGKVFSLEELFERVWGEIYFESNNTVMVHIARLREKIDDKAREDKIIKNVWGVGYKIEN